MRTTTKNYESWIWIELIGFDHTQADYGVAEYLDTVGFAPEAVSLLFFTPDFVHGHAGMEFEWTLPPEMCSYAARPFGKRNDRQPWTNFQLRGLVKELQSHGVAVYCSFFNLFLYRLEGKPQASRWCSEHSELYEMRASGEPLQVIHPLKRFKDGSYYEDLFLRDLMTVMREFGFDGFHGADGYTSSRLSLAESDYSDDMVEQFVRHAGTETVAGISLHCDGDSGSMKERADWIWTNRRMEWIRFHAERWGSLWDKIVAALHREGKKVVFNSAWTRDPFEALHRYGVDYRRIAESGVDGIIVESVGASLSAGADETEYEPGSEFMAMVMTLKAYVPGTKLICLNAIQDTNEQWDSLRHAPTVLERDIFSFSNVYSRQSDGAVRCASGFMACLGDGIDRDGWKWLTSRWDLGFGGEPSNVLGACLVWSDRLLHRNLETYGRTREWHPHKFAHELIERGALLHGTVNVGHLKNTSGAIVAVNVHLLPDDELQEVLDYRNGRVMIIGACDDRILRIAEEAGWKLECEAGDMFWAQAERTGGGNPVVRSASAGSERKQEEAGEAPNDAISWLHSLTYRHMPEELLEACVRWTAEDEGGAPRALRNQEYIRIAVLEMEPNRWRLLLRNLHMNYKTAQIEIGRTISSVQVLTDFPGIPVFPDQSRFRLYVPGRGMVIVDIRF
ncbi:hypothetical protein [Cohnella soli]|uniref:Uncharacterized protein n=1 Tax=Cohnella soli TaxID=425005 RepID=A0ABW0HWG9_9BACL